MWSAANRIVAFAVGVTVLVQLAGFLQVLHPLFDSISHFRLHLTIVLMLGSLGLLPFRHWRLAAISVATGLVGLAGLWPALVLPPFESEASVSRGFVLLQFNTLYDNAAPELIIAQVQNLRPDVITLQEVSSATSKILELLTKDYPYRILCPFNSIKGVAVLSKSPSLSQGCVKGEGLAWLEIQAHGRKVTVASLHLRWPFPYGQARQVSRLLPTLAAVTRPVFLAGDFNAAPWSHAVARIATATDTQVADGLRLSFEITPLGMGPWPILPIDQVLMPRDVTAYSVRTGNYAGSDHLPVIAELGFDKP